MIRRHKSPRHLTRSSISVSTQLSLFVGASAFSGPVSRRDAFKTLGAGLGAAAAVSSAGPAFAASTAIDVQQNYQDRLNVVRAEKNGNPYAKSTSAAFDPATSPCLHPVLLC